jgi:superfamily II helicase
VPSDEDKEVISVCPECLARHDRMTDVTGDHRPEEGDVNVCVVCKGISVYDSNVPTKLRFPTDEELAVIIKDPRISKIREVMKVMDLLYGRPRGKYFS